MPIDVLTTTSELEPKPTPVQMKKSPWSVVFRVILILLMVVSLSILALTIYIRVNFSEDIYVNGMSMFPTLNSDAKSLVDEKSYQMMFQDGDSYTFERSIKDGDLLDYGLSDPRKGSLKDLKRFDIVVTYYPSDYNGEVRYENAVPKIKRIIGLPGETVELRTDDTPMGKLFINDEVVEQPGNNMERYNAPFKKAGIMESYPASKNDSNAWMWANKKTRLGEDEYYVAGDNRFGLASSDSRTVGPIKTDYIHAKFALVVGVCRVGDSGKNCELQYTSLRWPWEYAIS